MDTATQLNTDEVQNLIEKSILSGRQLRIQYTNSKGITDHYLILSITSTWTNSFNTVAESLSKGRSSPFNKFRYDRISAVDITDEIYEPSDLLIEKLKDGSLFSEVDNRLARRGGLKGYASSVSYVTSSRERLTKDEARNLLRQIDISPLEGWERGIVVDITDGDTFDLLLESAPCGSYVTRLFGVDTPECNHNSEEEIFGLEAKVAIEDMFKTSRCCYVKREGTDAYRRHLMHVLNADKKNVAIELLENGLGFPMMGYFTERSLRDTYVNATCKAYEDHKGLWAIDEIRSRYNNVISDTSIIEIDILAYIPKKTSAINRYLKQSPKARIIYAALQRKRRYEANKAKSKDIFARITQSIDREKYDLNAFKELCQSYLKEIDEIAKSSDSIEAVKDHIMYIEDLIDDLQLGEGLIKGNFSKGKKKLVYHDNPENQYYKLCIPEISFRTVADAKYCGFKKGR